MCRIAPLDSGWWKRANARQCWRATQRLLLATRKGGGCPRSARGKGGCPCSTAIGQILWISHVKGLLLLPIHFDRLPSQKVKGVLLARMTSLFREVTKRGDQVPGAVPTVSLKTCGELKDAPLCSFAKAGLIPMSQKPLGPKTGNLRISTAKSKKDPMWPSADIYLCRNMPVISTFCQAASGACRKCAKRVQAFWTPP